ncbi:MAG: benzoate-CoA ligase family protein, partial [Myxococcales bacterium]
MGAPYNATVDVLERNLAHPDRVALRDAGRSVTYGELCERANRAGNALLALGGTMEQRVLLFLLDSADFVACFWGAIKAGLVPVPVNTLLTAADVDYMLRDSRARVLVVSEPLLEKLAPILRGQPFLKHVVVQGKGKQLDDLLAAASPRLEAAPTTTDDVAFWLYSSGSTGTPKGAMHLQQDLVQTARTYGAGVLKLRPDDVVFSAAKLFFAYGLGNAMTFPFAVGATVALLEGRPTPESVMRILREERPTVFYGVPTLFAAILADPNNGRARGSDRLRICVSAGEPLPKEIGERWRDRFGADILDGIGSTEMLHIFLSLREDDIRYGTTGKPVPGYDLRIVDETGRDVPAGEIGELLVRGPSSAVAYWNQREKSLRTFQGPWTYTGDKYRCDAEGYYVYCGRSDDMIKASGQWVSPAEVESALVGHPAVLEAAVVAHADEQKLDKPKAFVVLKNGYAPDERFFEAIKAHVKERAGPWKFPRWIDIRADLPRT